MRPFILFFFLLFPLYSWGWGERGHHVICEVATHLVTEKKMAYFVRNKGHMFGHLCNVPDIYWRDLGSVSKSGDDTHFMNFENLGYTAETAPGDFQQILIDKEGQTSPKLNHPIRVAENLGSSWWRADQFYRRALQDAKSAIALQPKLLRAKKAKKDVKTAQDNFNTAVFSMLTNMGLMGHFIGDAAQPYHNTTDYDGWDTGQGGVHSYYETQVVNELSLDLPKKVYDSAIARAEKSDLTASPVEALRKLTILALKDLETIRDADKTQVVVKPSSSPHKMKARRQSPREAVALFEPTIVKQMGHAARTLAQLWDKLASEAPELEIWLYESYAYPLKPDFVAPDYTKASPSVTPKKQR